MNTAGDHHSEEPTVAPQPSFWRKLGGGSLSISLIVHAVILALGLVWVIQRLPAPKPPEPYLPSGGSSGGGSPSVSTTVKQSKSVSLPSRVVSVGTVSDMVLSEMPLASTVTDGGALSSGSLTGTLGSRSGHGPDGNGPRNGIAGMDAGFDKPGITLFGLSQPNKNSLVGSFYDTKQDSNRKETGMTPEKIREVINDFTKTWSEKSLAAKYYKAPRELYQTKVFIPLMPAAAAPEAFGCEKEVQPSRWIVIYRGNVTPPKTGKYRFVGASDDVLVVRFNKKEVFDYGYSMGTIPLYSAGKSEVFSGKKENREMEKLIRRSPMHVPTALYPYESTPTWNQALGGFAVGPEFEAIAGQSYPIEILISEVPGGYFGACLLIEEKGVNYPKTSNGSPILPIFRLDDSLPAADQKNAPPFDAHGPVWKLTGGSTKPDI